MIYALPTNYPLHERALPQRREASNLRGNNFCPLDSTKISAQKIQIKMRRQVKRGN